MNRIEFVTYYDRATRSWWGYWSDGTDQITDALFAHQRDDLLISLGEQRAEALKTAEGAA